MKNMNRSVANLLLNDLMSHPGFEGQWWDLEEGVQLNIRTSWDAIVRYYFQRGDFESLRDNPKRSENNEHE